MPEKKMALSETCFQYFSRAYLKSACSQCFNEMKMKKLYRCPYIYVVAK